MADASSFQRLLELLGRGADTIRIGRGDEHEFKVIQLEPEHVPDLIPVAEAEHWNLWFEVQPSNFDRPTGRSNAGDISRLAALYADIDFKSEGVGSIAAAMDLVHDLEGAIGAPPAAIVSTGHGMQPYWLVENGEITDENRSRMQALLRRWGMLVEMLAQAGHGHVDNVFDLPRILRVPGSTNYKSTPVPTEIEFGPAIYFSPDEIDEVLNAHEIYTAEAEVATGIVSPTSSWSWAEHDCDFTDVARSELETSTPNARHPWALKYAAILYGMVRSECVREETFYQLRDLLVERFGWLCRNVEPRREPSAYEIGQILRWGQGQAEAWSSVKLGAEMRNHVHHDFLHGFNAAPAPVSRETPADPYLHPGPMGAEAVRPQLAYAEGQPEPEKSNVSSIYTGQPLAYATTDQITAGALAVETAAKQAMRLGLASFTDTGNGERLASSVHNSHIFVPEIGWHVWDGSRFVPDAKGGIQEVAKDLFMSMLNGADKPEAVKWAHQSLNQARLNAAVKSAQTVPYIVVEASELDSNGFELCTPGGVVDLRSGIVRPGNPLVDRHTLSAMVAPATMPTPLFDGLLAFAIEDPERIAYLQRLFGLAAIGKLLHHVFPIFLGVGANGKTTIMDVVSGVLGQYAAQMPKNFLVEKRGDQHPTEIAQLRGVRMSVSPEVSSNAVFDEQLVKTLSGESKLRARFIGKDFYEFENRATPFFIANHLPAVRAGGTSFFRRVRKVDFHNVKPNSEQDPNLVAKILATEAPGVLAWIVEGSRQVLLGGLRDPESVLISTRAYQLEEDTVARFIDEHLQEFEGIEVSREAVYERYKFWARRFEPGQMLTYTKFCREILTAFPKAGLGTRAMFTNLTLLAIIRDEEDD